MSKVIEVNGIFYKPEDAIYAITGLMVDSMLLVDHPDEAAEDNAIKLLQLMSKNSMLASKTAAIVDMYLAYTALEPFMVEEE